MIPKLKEKNNQERSWEDIFPSFSRWALATVRYFFAQFLSFFLSSVDSFLFIFAGTPATRLPVGTTIPAGTRLPAATIDCLPIFTPSKTVEFIPIKHSSSISHAWITAPCPTVTYLPTNKGNSSARCPMTPSCKLENFPIFIELMSPRKTPPYQRL